VLISDHNGSSPTVLLEAIMLSLCNWCERKKICSGNWYSQSFPTCRDGSYSKNDTKRHDFRANLLIRSKSLQKHIWYNKKENPCYTFYNRCIISIYYVKSPNEGNYKKLTRVIQYTRDTQHITLAIKPSDNPQRWVESSYAVHPTRKVTCAYS